MRFDWVTPTTEMIATFNCFGLTKAYREYIEVLSSFREV